MYNEVPCHILAQSIKDGYFRFLGYQHVASMLEADDISRLWIPSFAKLRGGSGCDEFNSVRPVFLTTPTKKQKERIGET